MKVQFEFNMPEDDADYRIYAQASAMYSIVHELQNEMRTAIKHGKPKQLHTEHWQARLYALIEENDVSLEF